MKNLSLPYKPRKKIYESTNVYFDPETCQAYSYDWWRFVDKIDGLVIFNSYSYSRTTQKHQYKVRRLLAELNIKINIEVDAGCGLQGNFWHSQTKQNYLINYGELKTKLKYCRPKNKDFYKSQLKHLVSKIKSLAKLGIIITKTELDSAFIESERIRSSKLVKQVLYSA